MCRPRPTPTRKGPGRFLSLNGGTYQVSVSKPGFKVATVSNVILAAGAGQEVITKLEVGQATETVTVTGGAEVVQATSAEITNELTGRQVTELPFATRNAVELMVTQPGTKSPTDPRSSTINGLPKGSINITLDGINTQDNYLKSGDGFFSYIMPSVRLAGRSHHDDFGRGRIPPPAGRGADQVRDQVRHQPVSRRRILSGAQHLLRRTNYYFNNENWTNNVTTPARRATFCTCGSNDDHIGGPVLPSLRDKLSSSWMLEDFRNPANETVATAIANPSYYTSGNYNYLSTTGAVNTVNLYNIAASGNASLPAGTTPFATTIDPTVQKVYNTIAGIEPAFSSLVPNSGSGDYNSSEWNFQVPGLDERNFYTARLDYNLTQKHHISITYDYDHYFGQWDLLNGVYAGVPGQGVVLGTTTAQGPDRPVQPAFRGHDLSPFGAHGAAHQRTEHGVGRRQGAPSNPSRLLSTIRTTAITSR